MVLKKQTVWLLTMLSLVIVLSVYYITSPEQAPTDEFAYNDEEQVNEEGMNEDTTNNEVDEIVVESMEDGTVISSISSDDLFTALRIDIDDARSAMTEQLQAVITSADVSAEQKSEAMDKMQELQMASAKESILETLIKAEGYEDALVNAEGNQVKVIVKANEPTKAQAVRIMQIVSNELGNKHVAVEFQPTK
jgi:stage III sporulation protein AH